MRVSTISAFLLTSTIIFADCQNASERMHVADYSGKVHTVRYDPPTLTGVQGNLIVIESPDLCGPKPSWLFKGPNKERLWCVGEGLGFAAGLSHYTIAADGKLGKLGGKTVVGAPVHAAFAFNDSGVVTAQYGGMNGSGSGGGVSFWKFENENIQDAKLPDQRVFPKLANPGDSPQDVPRAHQVVPDPSGRFAVVPDLGADKLRVLGVNTSGMAVLDDLEYQLPKGTGPRHAVFFKHAPWSNGPSTQYLLVVNEIANSIITFNVSYPAGRLNLTLSREQSTLNGSNLVDTASVQTNFRAGEIKVAPCNRLVTVSNRNIGTIMSENYQDSLASFEVNADGSLRPADYKPIPFKRPRGLEFHPLGDKVLVAAQISSTVAVYARNTLTGVIGDLLASYKFNTTVGGIEAGISHAIWDHR